jgi:hypothetical protein
MLYKGGIKMFQPLKGDEHIKAYFFDDGYREQYNKYAEERKRQWINKLKQYHAAMLATDKFNYIFSPSFYDGIYQLTTFSKDMIPLSHNCYNSIDDLVNDNIFFYTQDISLIESIN